MNLDEVLAVLDSDTRPYLQLLINGAGKGPKGRGGDLSKTLRQLGPLQRDTRRVSGALAQRKANLRRLVNRYGRLTQEVGASDRDLVRLVRASNVVFSVLRRRAREPGPGHRAAAGHAAPDADHAERRARLRTRLAPALQALRPTVRELDPATRSLLPAGPRGHADRARPPPSAHPGHPRAPEHPRRRGGRPAPPRPDLTTSLGKVNRLLNMVAFNPGGAESLAGKSFDQQRNRPEGYLYWAGWVAPTAARCSARPTARACSGASRWATPTAARWWAWGCRPS